MAGEVSAAGISHRYLQPTFVTKRALASTWNQCNLPRLVRRYTGMAFREAVGDTVNIRLPVQLTSGRGENINTGTNSEADNASLVERYARLKLQTQFHVAIKNLARSDLTIHITRERLRDFYREIGTELATAIDLAMCKELTNNIGMYFGSKDELISMTHFSRAKAYLKKVPIPKDGKIFALLDNVGASVIETSIVGPQNRADTAKGSGALNLDKMKAISLKKDFIGMIYGVATFESEHVPMYKTGTFAGTPLVMGGDQSGSSLETDGWSDGDVVEAGTIIEIAGVNQLNTRSKTSFRKASFAVTEKATAPANGQLTLKISPEINAGDMSYTKAGGGSTTTTAYNTHSARPADNAVITVVGGSNATLFQALVVHKRCMTRADVPLAQISDIVGQDTGFTVSGPEAAKIGMTMRCLKDIDIDTAQAIMRVDTWQAFSVTEPLFAIRIIGKNFTPILADLSTSA